MRKLASNLIHLYFSIKYFRQILWALLLFSFFLVISTTLFVSNQIITKPIGWEKSKLITPYKLKIKNNKVVTRGKFIASVYEAITGKENGIYLSLSFNGGKTFLKPKKVISFLGDIENRLNPSIAISGKGQISVFWHRIVGENETSRIFNSNSLDYGTNWTEEKRIFLGSEIEMLPRVFYDRNNRMHLFYHGFRDGIFNLFYTYSSDGVNFEESKELIKMTQNMKGAFFPSIKFFRNNIYITWQGKLKKTSGLSDNLFFMKSSNLGSSWDSPSMITDSLGNDAEPFLEIFDNILYLTYQNNDKKSWSIKLITSLDGGSEWSNKPIDISLTNSNCYSPALVKSLDSIFFVWYDNREKKEQIFSRKYTVSIKKFSKELKLSENRGRAKNPYPISQGEKIVVFWEQSDRLYVKESDIYVAPLKVKSNTHKDGLWSKNSTVRLYWKTPRDESGISGYATMLNDLPYFNPVIKNLGATSTKVIISDIEDGISYFHIRAIDEVGNYSRSIHYKLMTSVNPLSIPIVISPTHPEGKGSKKRDAAFKWVVENKTRLKGFVYSLTKNSVGRPDKYTDEFSINFKNLENGRYSFNIGAVDQTGQVSKVSYYQFGVGDVSDFDYIEPSKRRKFKHKTSPVLVSLSFNNEKVLNLMELSTEIIAKNISKSKIDGYSIVYDKKKIIPPRIVLTKNNQINIKNLTDGDYYIGLRLRYFKDIKGKRFYFWTKPKIIKFTVLLPVMDSKITKFGKLISQKIEKKFQFLVLIIFIYGLVLLYAGFGSRITFFFKKISYKTRILFGVKL